jgi:hypothetical protein
MVILFPSWNFQCIAENQLHLKLILPSLPRFLDGIALIKMAFQLYQSLKDHHTIYRYLELDIRCHQPSYKEIKMGVETAALIVAALAVGAEATYEVKAANAKQEALDREADQMRLTSQQKALKNYDVMQKVLDAQIAHQTTTGTAFSSPSFNAIQRQTLNIGSKSEKNIDIEGLLAMENIKMEKENVRNTLFAQLFGNVAQVASVAYTGAHNAPTTGA